MLLLCFECNYNNKETLWNNVLHYICKNVNMEEQQINPQLNIEITEEMSEGE